MEMTGGTYPIHGVSCTPSFKLPDKFFSEGFIEGIGVVRVLK